MSPHRPKYDGFYTAIVERLPDASVRLACGHVQPDNGKPRAKTICGTCRPADRERYASMGGFKRGETPMVTMHCPHAMTSPCSTCEASAAARELRALRALKVAVDSARKSLIATGVHHAEIRREEWFAVVRASELVPPPPAPGVS